MPKKWNEDILFAVSSDIIAARAHFFRHSFAYSITLLGSFGSLWYAVGIRASAGSLILIIVS